jgi:hypothetical protein
MTMSGSGAGNDLERLLRDRLERTARQLPSDALGSVLERVATTPQLAPRRRDAGWRSRTALALAVAVVAILAVLIGPQAMDRIGSMIPNGRAPGPVVNEAMHWDALLQFRGAPGQSNPAGDGYGNRIVFSYLDDSGNPHDPSQYRLLGAFATGELDRWYDAGGDGVSVGWVPGSGVLQLQPAGGGTDSRAAIVAWRSPVNRAVVLAGEVEVDATCGDGIVFSIDRGAETLETFHLGGGARVFSHELNVAAGDTIYLIVEPGSNSFCDTTWLTATIDTR